MGIPRPRALVVLLGCSIFLAGSMMGAAATAATEPRDLGDYVLLWASGPYTAPAICELPGGPRRVARTLQIRPPRNPHPGALHRLTIQPMGVGDAHCTNDLGKPEPEIVGFATLRYTGPEHTDTARHDFEQALRRERGFDFALEQGELKVGVGDAQTRVDLKGGTLRISLVPPGSDAARMLGDVGGLAKRILEIRARDGTRFVFDAVHVVPRGPRGQGAR